MFSSFLVNISVRDWREGNSMAQIALIGEDRQMSVRGDYSMSMTSLRETKHSLREIKIKIRQIKFFYF